MWNGIKPTHLWHKTGMKHMKNMLSARDCARFEAVFDRVYDVRDRRDLWRFVGLIFGSAVFANYLFGTFSKLRCKDGADAGTAAGADRLEPKDDAYKVPPDPCPPITPPSCPKKCPIRPKS